MQQTNNDLVMSKFKKICKTFFLPNTINNKYNNNGLMNEVSKLFQFADALYQNQKRDSSHFFNHILEFLHNSYNFSKFSLNKYLSKLTILFEVGSEKGDPASLNILGLKYYNGDKKDYLKAKEYFKLASKQNDSYGFLNLGYYYFDGFSEAKDYFQAENYFRLSAKLGNSTAYYELGCMYEKGYGVKITNKKTNQYKKAIKYYKKSTELNNTDALIKLGKLYFKGLGVEQDYTKAIEYYKLSSAQKNPKALMKLGKLYHKGLIVEQNFIEARNYFELVSLQNYPDSYFYLADLYSTGEFFEVNLSYAIQNFQKCIEIDKQLQLVFNTNDESVLRKSRKNNYKSRSQNDLGLIYLILYDDIEEAKNKLKYAANDEYPFGQNNFGLFSQFYLYNINEAKHRFEKASKNHFALAEYNMGYLLEEEGNIDEAIKYYCKASDNQNQPLIFHNHQHYDKRLEISKIFILCLTNLKIAEHYLSISDVDKSKKYFIKSFEKMITNDDNSFYRFHFVFHKNKEMKEDISYLRSFIFNYPPFNFINPKNIDLKSQVNLKVTKQTKQNDQDSKYNYSLFALFKKLYYFIYNKIDYYWKSETIKNPTSELNKNFTDEKQNKINLFNEIQIINENNENIHSTIALNEDLIIKEPAKLFDIVQKNENMKTAFIDEVRYIIKLMNEILYQPPYHILFGRIFIDKIKQKRNKSKSKISIICFMKDLELILIKNIHISFKTI